MKTGLIIFTALCLLTGIAMLPANMSGRNRASDGCKGKIIILGTTNVSDFKLVNQLSHILLKRCSYGRDSATMQSKKFWLQIPVKTFKTSNQQIYRDFLSLIRAEEYPSIRIGISMADLHKLAGRDKYLSLPAEVNMAGKNCRYQVKCSVSGCNQTDFLVTGSQEMKLTDFGITPPQKFFGLIKVHDEILVTFDFAVSIQ